MCLKVMEELNRTGERYKVCDVFVLSAKSKVLGSVISPEVLMTIAYLYSHHEVIGSNRSNRDYKT